MKTIKNLSMIFAALVLLFSTNSCKRDLLDTVPGYQFSGENVWISAELTRAAVTGVYSSLLPKFTQNYTGAVQGVPLDAYSSVMDIDMNWRGACFVITGSMTPSTGNLANVYKLYYTIVYRANDVINNIDKCEALSEAERSRLKSECKFLRAWAYTYLNIQWNGVPIYTENVMTSEATKPRSSAAEVWDLIIKDLTDVIEDKNIPDKYNAGSGDYGRVTRGAALCYRGQAYQFIKDYSKALEDFDRVGELGYALYSPSNGAPGNDDFFQLLKPKNEQCDEMIFSIQCVEVPSQGNPRGINYGNRSTGGSAWNNYLPNPAFVEMFENADGSQFDWAQYFPDWHKMQPKERVVFFLRDGLKNRENGKFGKKTDEDWAKFYKNMEDYGADMSKYLDAGNEARIKHVYENRDPRLMQSIITPYSEYNGNTSSTGNHTFTLRWPYCAEVEEPFDIRTDTNAKYYYLWRKYVTNYDECTTRWVYPQDIILWRYAEVLLRKAECLNELGRTSEAVACVNQVRKRCGHVLLNSSPATMVSGQDDMRERIRREFYCELGGEDSMFFNELRWGIWYDRKFRDHSSGKVGEMNTNGLMQMWGETTYKHQSVGEQLKNGWPIPAKEIEMNNSITQTQGWSN